MTRIDPVVPAPEALALAAAVLREGGLVAFPTETFYGLGALALDPRAVRRVFEVKGRSGSRPLLVLVDSIAMAEDLVAEVPAAARDLMARHWPGALTLVFRATRKVPEELTAGTGTIGIRLSSHPVARGLVRAVGHAVTAPSANPEGEVPPTAAEAVLEHFDGVIEAVLDGGPTAGGPPSTVLDVTVDPPSVLRRGAVVL